jgi:hypothetical protein
VTCVGEDRDQQDLPTKYHKLGTVNIVKRMNVLFYAHEVYFQQMKNHTKSKESIKISPVPKDKKLVTQSGSLSPEKDYFKVATDNSSMNYQDLCYPHRMIVNQVMSVFQVNTIIVTRSNSIEGEQKPDIEEFIQSVAHSCAEFDCTQYHKSKYIPPKTNVAQLQLQ